VREVDRLLGLNDQTMFLPDSSLSVRLLAVHLLTILSNNGQLNKDSSLALFQRTNLHTINSLYTSSLTMEMANGLAMDTATAHRLPLPMATQSRNKPVTTRIFLRAHLSDLPHLLAVALRLTTRNNCLLCILS
jgi:hypothetical protein